MELYFKKLLWPSLVLALLELIFVQSQPHWLLVTLGFALINAALLYGLQFIVRRPASEQLP